MSGAGGLGVRARGAAFAVCLTTIAVVLGWADRGGTTPDTPAETPTKAAAGAPPAVPVRAAMKGLADRITPPASIRLPAAATGGGAGADSVVCIPCRDRKTEPALPEPAGPPALLANGADSPFYQVTGSDLGYRSPADIGRCLVAAPWPDQGTILIIAGEPLGKLRGRFRMAAGGMALIPAAEAHLPADILVDDEMPAATLGVPALGWAAQVMARDLRFYATALRGDLVTGQVVGPYVVQSAGTDRCLLRNARLEDQPQHFDDAEIRVDRQGRVVSVQRVFSFVSKGGFTAWRAVLWFDQGAPTAR